MFPSKIATLCLVGFILFSNYIQARPAPEEGPEKVVHHHHVHHHKEGEGEPHIHHHVHHHKEEPHVHHHKIKEGEPHVHHHKIAGGSGSGGAGGGAGAGLGLGGSGSGGLPNLENLGFSQSTIKKFKKMLSNMNIDLSQLDLGDLDLGGGGAGGALGLGGGGAGGALGLGGGGAGGSLGLGGGGAGGAGGGAGANGGGGIHKTNGKDSLQPQICDDSINDRYGVGKHFVRGTRDVGDAILSEAQNILDPLFGGLTFGLGQGLKKILCEIENGFSDFGSDFDSATDIAKHGLVNFFKLQGPHPVLGIPVGIAGIAGEAVKAAASIGGDAVSGIGGALHKLVSNL